MITETCIMVQQYDPDLLPNDDLVSHLQAKRHICFLTLLTGVSNFTPCHVRINIQK